MTIDTKSGGISGRRFLGTASCVFAASKKVHRDEQIASNWDLDGERWWFG